MNLSSIEEHYVKAYRTTVEGIRAELNTIVATNVQDFDKNFKALEQIVHAIHILKRVLIYFKNRKSPDAGP